MVPGLLLVSVAWFAAIAGAAVATSVAAEEAIKDLGTGEGLIYVPGFGETTESSVAFEPRYAAAFRARDPSRIFLLFTDRDASSLKWGAAEDRVSKLARWCKSENAPFVLFELDLDGAPQLVHECGGTGALSTEMISTINDLASVVPDYQIFEKERIRGSIMGGKGACGDTWCEKTREFYMDVTVQE